MLDFIDPDPLQAFLLILGAVGMLQFDVVAFRLQDEYGVQATWDNVNVYTARWVYGSDPKKIEEFRAKARWSTSPRRASTCSSRSSAGST